MSARVNGSPLWMIGPASGGLRKPFAGTLFEAVAEANRLHALTGIQHAARAA